jgi:hypothetical protein
MRPTEPTMEMISQYLGGLSAGSLDGILILTLVTVMLVAKVTLYVFRRYL